MQWALLGQNKLYSSYLPTAEQHVKDYGCHFGYNVTQYTLGVNIRCIFFSTAKIQILLKAFWS